MSFVHLHVHSQYSFLDGASTLDHLLEKAKALEMPALAVTDHNRLTGAIRFYDKARELGIKPIIGVEVDITGGYHLTLLCTNLTGYTSLCRLITETHLSNPNHEPAATREMLAKFGDGLIALSGCNRGEVPTLLRQRRMDEARQAANFYRELYQGFYIELVRYPGREMMRWAYSLQDFARREKLPVVATNNVHYVEKEAYRIKELLNAIDQNITVWSLDQFRTVEQYLKSPEAMAVLFRDVPEALTATLEIADRCNLELPLGKPRFPKADVPDGETEYSYLRHLAHQGAADRYNFINQEVEARLEYELETINGLGFSGYFLVVWDIMRWAEERRIRCQARGSAVDSLVVYALGISNVDPIAEDLLFERFMHSLRNEPPDIDIDVDRERRDELRNYIYQKYGEENVACVGTINCYLARGAIRDVGKALHLSREIIDDVCSGVRYTTVTKLLDKVNALPELRNQEIYRRPEVIEFLRLCAAIDRFPNHMSVHLGGLLIGAGRLSDLVPLERSSGGDIISQYDKDDVERLGIVKMDILALPTITVIEETVASVARNRGITLDIDRISKDDMGVFAMYREGKTVGIFQLESPAQREMAGRMLPRCYNDVMISISLVRPGPLKSDMDKQYLPRRHGKARVTYLHPRLEPALKETLGIILYQEQVLRVAHDLAGMSYAEADGFRRAMTHDRTNEEMEKMRQSFIRGALRNRVPRDVADKVFEQLTAFAAYGFCKAHAAAYAILSYQTLWLKYHYPVEFFAALLSNQPMGYYPSRVLVDEAKRCGVQVLPPDVRYSTERYTVDGDAIRVSLSQLKGMSAEAIESIIRAREERAFSSLRDFVLRTETSQPMLENLALVGGLDGFGDARSIMAQIPGLVSAKRRTVRGLKPMFDADEAGVITRSNNSNDFDRTTVEWELLSLYLSANPFDRNPPPKDCVRFKDLKKLPTGSTVRLAGSVIRYQSPHTKSEKRVVYIILEDGTGIADITVFSDVQEKCGEVLFRERIIKVKGKIQRRGPKALSIIADTIEPLR